MGQVEVSSKVALKLKKLVFILYKKEYFGFMDSAIAYVDKIRETVRSIPELKHSKTRNSKYGSYYVRYKANSNTIYYITFDKKGDRYLVKNIISSHEAHYPIYIRNTTI